MGIGLKKAIWFLRLKKPTTGSLDNTIWTNGINCTKIPD